MSSDFERAANKLRNLGPTISSALPEAVEAGAAVLEPAVAANVPIQDGDLRRSVGSKPIEASANRASHQVHVAAVHGLWVEYGHGGPKPAPAHPFFRPATEAARPEIIRAVLGRILEASREAMG